MNHSEIQQLRADWLAADNDCRGSYGDYMTFHKTKKAEGRDFWSEFKAAQDKAAGLFEEYKKAVQETYNYVGRGFKYLNEWIFVSDVAVQSRNGAICFYGIGFKLMGAAANYNWGFFSKDSWCVELEPDEDPVKVMQEIDCFEFMDSLEESFGEWDKKVRGEIDKINANNGNRQGETAGDVSRA